MPIDLEKLRRSIDIRNKLERADPWPLPPPDIFEEGQFRRDSPKERSEDSSEKEDERR